MTTKWQGLWAQERAGFYAGKVIKKADIPKYTRIVLRYNKFYEKDGNRPRFVYCFADSDGYADKCVPIEYEEAERLFTRDDCAEMKQEFLRMASYIDCLLECSDEQKETLLGFISRLAEYMPWTERD